MTIIHRIFIVSMPVISDIQTYLVLAFEFVSVFNKMYKSDDSEEGNTEVQQAFFSWIKAV
jgi:hypothetical protein